MAKINILPAKVYNRIAAGEVVDRPYSVVKELVENAIDAGATQIEIFIEDGGKQLIEVIDNGCGIERDDLHSAYLPHATSKIATAEDLEKIGTLGFRGEAVASIASVSKMNITSKVEGGKCYQLSCEGGAVGKITEVSGEKGTTVRVEALFFNTPVRLGFLKSDKAEEADITTYVSRFILNRADIAFTYYVNGKKVLQSFGEGMEAALVNVYGAATLSQCYKIDAEKHGIHIYGYIGNQNFSKANKSYQSIFLNGRYVLNSTIAAAISGAYASYLMKRQYPFYVLHIDVPKEIVDVNVHPNKADVRFADNKIIYGCIYSVISSVLDGNSKALNYIAQESMPTQPENEPQPATNTGLSQEAINEFKEYNKKREQPQTSGMPTLQSSTLSDAILKQAEEEKNKVVRGSFSYEDALKEIELCRAAMQKENEPKEYPKGYVRLEDVPDMDPNDMVVMTEEEMRNVRVRKKDTESLHRLFPDLPYQRRILEFDDPEYERAKENGTLGDFFEENKKLLHEQEERAKQNKIDVQSCIYRGKLFNTYLMFEYNEEVYIVDQHAAHERIIFDKLKEKMKNREIVKQPMLVPFELKINAFESAFIREKLTEIADMGFDIQDGGDGLFIVNAIPADLQSIDLSVFFNEILANVNNYRAIKLEELLKDKLASAACKAAVKGGMNLAEGEVIELLRQMDGDMGLKCPHGRPVVVKMTRTQIEKMFKRIV